MMKRFFMALFLILVFTTAHAGDKIVLATLDWEPYVGQNMKNQGYVAEVVKEAFKRSGMEVEIQFHQWSRVVGLAKAGKVDGYFPEYLSDEVKKYAAFSIPMPGGPLGFFKRSDTDISYQALQDLKGKKIGVVKGYVNTKEFDDAGYLTKDPAKDDLTNFKKLLAGRLDLLVADKFVGTHLMKTSMPDKAASVEFMSPPLAEPDLYVCISNKAKAHADKLKAFNAGLEQIKADGTLDNILKSHGF
ncbi:MAG: transporter substrate-binding domain-containing protein [Desulfobacter sp.]|nr:MAG: transporter substrate-binding domain-containing protein [Desulfobacter sp.]